MMSYHCPFFTCKTPGGASATDGSGRCEIKAGVGQGRAGMSYQFEFLQILSWHVTVTLYREGGSVEQRLGGHHCIVPRLG